MDDQQRIVIVGAGQAGGWVAKTLRAKGFAGKIVLYGSESHRPYERPPLSKGVLLGSADPASLALFEDAVFDALEVDFRPAASVVSVDRERGTIFLADGGEDAFDKLVLATGGRARTLDGLSGDRVFTLRTIEDSLAIRAALGSARKATIIGGGWIGLEIAAAASSMNVDVQLLEMADRLCARAIPPIISDWLLQFHRCRGIDVQLGRPANGIPADSDMVVVGAGLIANDELAITAGLPCDNGILTDPFGRTQDPAIFACGDVARFPVAGAPSTIRLESWSNAQNQAIACAGLLMGEEPPPREVPWFWSDQYDANIQIVGLPPADQPAIVRGSLDDPSFSVFWTEDTRVVSAIAVNAPTDIKIARRFIERSTEIPPDRLADTAVPLKKLL